MHRHLQPVATENSQVGSPKPYQPAIFRSYRAPRRCISTSCLPSLFSFPLFVFFPFTCVADPLFLSSRPSLPPFTTIAPHYFSKWTLGLSLDCRVSMIFAIFAAGSGRNGAQVCVRYEHVVFRAVGRNCSRQFTTEKSFLESIAEIKKRRWEKVGQQH